MRPYEKLHTRWRQSGYSGGGIYKDIFAPLEDCGFPFPDQAMVQEIERQHDVKIPADLFEHLLHVPLTGEGIDGGELVLFWSADCVTSIADKYKRSRWLTDGWEHPGCPETHLIFCDYMVSCWDWAVECAPGPNHGKIVLVSSDADEWFVYDSFAEMVDDYVAKDHIDFAHRWNRPLR